jgi:hypothetical protein
VAVGDLERFVARHLEAEGYEFTVNSSFAWLSGLGPFEPSASSAPEPVRQRLTDMHAALGGDLQKLQNKRRSSLPVDFDLGDRLLLEVDEPQHFSTPRLQTLDFYEGLQHDLDIDRYRDLCIRYSGEADSYRRTKTAADFPFPGGRTAQRAYLDAVRDLLAPAFGFTFIRIPSPTRDMRRAALEAAQAISARMQGRA